MTCSPGNRYFTSQVEKALADLAIPVYVWDVDLFNMHEVLRHVAGIIKIETGNRVYVNISACGRFTSIGTTLAGMAHDAEVYYVEADAYAANEDDMKEHGQSICFGSVARVLDPLRFKMPDESAMKLLVELSGVDEMRTEQLVEFMRVNRVGVYKKDPNVKLTIQQTLTSLNKTILDRLEENGYVSRKREGRERRVKITRAGLNMAYLSGLMPISKPIRSSVSPPSRRQGSP